MPSGVPSTRRRSAASAQSVPRSCSVPTTRPFSERHGAEARNKELSESERCSECNRRRDDDPEDLDMSHPADYDSNHAHHGCGSQTNESGDLQKIGDQRQPLECVSTLWPSTRTPLTDASVSCQRLTSIQSPIFTAEINPALSFLSATAFFIEHCLEDLLKEMALHRVSATHSRRHSSSVPATKSSKSEPKRSIPGSGADILAGGGGGGSFFPNLTVNTPGIPTSWIVAPM